MGAGGNAAQARAGSSGGSGPLETYPLLRWMFSLVLSFPPSSSAHPSLALLLNLAERHRGRTGMFVKINLTQLNLIRLNFNRILNAGTADKFMKVIPAMFEYTHPAAVG